MINKKIVFLMLPLFAMCLTSCSGSSIHHDESEYFLNLDYKSDYKILQLCDIHVTMTDDLDRHFKFMDLTIKDADPDLIVLDGDLFTFATKYVANSLFSFINSYNVPWAVTFGNHDEQTYFSATELSNMLNNDYKNTCFKDIIGDDVFGNANYVINLKQDDKVKYEIIIMDSNRYRYDNMGYDNFHDDQVAWYERVVNYSTSINGRIVPSLSFFHIPFEEYQIAYDLYKSGSNEVTHFYGENYESVSCSQNESQMFEKMVELKSTKGTFVGHDHTNCSDIEYKGIRLVYGIHSTDRVYHRKDLLGGQVITIHDDETFDIKRIFHTYEELDNE